MPELLSARGLTQAEFARRLGVSEAFISQVISGKKLFSYQHALNAARILRCTMEDLHEIE